MSYLERHRYGVQCIRENPRGLLIETIIAWLILLWAAERENNLSGHMSASHFVRILGHVSKCWTWIHRGRGGVGETQLYVFWNLLSYGSKTLVKQNPMVPHVYVFLNEIWIKLNKLIIKQYLLLCCLYWATKKLDFLLYCLIYTLIILYLIDLVFKKPTAIAIFILILVISITSHGNGY